MEAVNSVMMVELALVMMVGISCLWFGIEHGIKLVKGIVTHKREKTVNVFLCGPITGHEKEAKNYFAEASRYVKRLYGPCKVFNPMKIKKCKTYAEYMNVTTAYIKNKKPIIALIVNKYTEASTGTKAEIELANSLKLGILSIKDDDEKMPTWW